LNATGYDTLSSTTQIIPCLAKGKPSIAGLAELAAGTLAPGADANLILVDPQATWTVDPGRFLSKGKHSPFAGWTLPGMVTTVVLRGEAVP